MSGKGSDDDQGARSPDKYTNEETARRRDAVIKRMLNTPPQPRKPKKRRTSKDRQ
jgi:hypothetical protein